MAMFHRSVVLLAAFSALTVSALADNPTAVDLKELQGEWQAVELEAQGKKAPAEDAAKFRLVIKGNEMTFLASDRKATFKLDPTQSPKAIDLVPLDGPD